MQPDDRDTGVAEITITANEASTSTKDPTGGEIAHRYVGRSRHRSRNEAPSTHPDISSHRLAPSR